MKKRIGSKLYDTDKAECILPEANLYKQPKNRTFFTFDGTIITPITFEQAEEIIRGAGSDLYNKIFPHKADAKGMGRIAVDIEYIEKLAAYSRRVGIPQKKIIEEFIDSLPE